MEPELSCPIGPLSSCTVVCLPEQPPSQTSLIGSNAGETAPSFHPLPALMDGQEGRSSQPTAQPTSCIPPGSKAIPCPLPQRLCSSLMEHLLPTPTSCSHNCLGSAAIFGSSGHHSFIPHLLSTYCVPSTKAGDTINKPE